MIFLQEKRGHWAQSPLASIDTYFHRFLITSDVYYVMGDRKKSGEIAEKGFQRLESKPEYYGFLDKL
ncbi:MAG: hypothetical protein D3925_15650 [Candidatus Electrothrix sp. AR5]|nr:hypothetical protein [Candidatus Electrothrix sp. AR5]